MYQNELKRAIAEKEIRDIAREAGTDMSTFVLDDAKLKELYLKMGGVYEETPVEEVPVVETVPVEEESKVVRTRVRKNVK